MRKKAFGTLGLALLLCLGAFSAAMASQTEMIKAMADMDRVFIPCLALTNKAKIGPSTKAVTKFKNMWTGFAAKYSKAMPNDADWSSDIEMSSGAIQNAYNAITKDKDCEGAHHALEEVRFNTLQMRTRNKIPYYLDYLNQFHEVMEPLVHDYVGKAPSSWTPEDMKEMARNTAEAHAAWKTAAGAKLDAAQWGFKPGKMDKLHKVYAQGDENFNALQKALASGDKKTAAKSLNKVKPIYSQAFKLFGDFKQFMK